MNASARRGKIPGGTGRARQSQLRDYYVEAANVDPKNSGKSDADANTISPIGRAQGQAGIANDLAAEVARSEQQPTRARRKPMTARADRVSKTQFAESAKLYRQVTQYQSKLSIISNLASPNRSGPNRASDHGSEKAVELAPTYIEAHRVLAAILGSQGKTIESNKHQQLAQQHQQRLQQLWRSRQLK